ncbi:uncharacterized protein NECHADRAFT_88925 [Fusarium vanettenii 77-13-4]|uniref:Cytochrome P450 n=1 Tax=Fusarium vanettenii (strain ATCC MYA-4622 / CBS 123669 / FGSC 9596 / NRRL 45880 / 77-13-4) TaxID=660122 RepID=C7ZGT3_FUSV7|nr:uncharacterized protein NECHADRAFT_88925 [Fusarium vanettenii 77-13-4]EEU36768.1 hypothetical protein NECHADRAFT_88925 [Fusarium vanettenii 77-13-4]
MLIFILPVVAAAVAIAYGVIWVLVDYVRILRLRRRMAPGLFPLPLFGNIFQIPNSRQWKKFEEWSFKYQSPIITIWDGHTPVIICNDAWSMSNLCDKMANIYSSRANESKLLINECLNDPGRFVQGALRFTVSIVSVIAWGRRISSESDNVLKLRKLADTSNKYFYALSVEGAEAAQDNFAKRLLREKEEHGLTKVEISNLTGNFIGAGVDTTMSIMLTFVLAMCLNPYVQHKAQEEIDGVIGHDRYPDWSDEGNLPYLAAIINETLRWRPAFALGGPPHAPTEDHVHNGFLIPKGTAVIGNLYAISRNPREYP